MKNYFLLILIVISSCIFSQVSSGPGYIKNALTASGVYNTPGYEFTTKYDSYNKSTSNGTIKGMFLHGLPYSKALNGNNSTKLFCWYGEPAGLKVGDKVPAVILIHGGGGKAYTAWVDQWINRGYIAIALSLLGNTPDASSWEYSGPPQPVFFSDNDEALQDQWFYHAIGGAMLANSLLRYSGFTSHVDTTHIGVTGISWGGINNTVLAGIDDRLDFVIPVYGCGFLYNSPIYSSQLASMTATARAFYYANWEPSLYVPLHKAPILFIDGNKDLQFTLNIFSKTYETSSSPEKYLRIQDKMVHGHAPGWTPQEIYDFADYVTGFRSTAIKPLTFDAFSMNNDKLVNYNYSYKGQVDEAILYYCTDTLKWGKTDPYFIWQKTKANLTKETNGGRVTVTVPDSAQVYYLNINNTADGHIYSSAMKYAYRDYDWYNYGKSIFNTIISKTTGGVLTESTTNPETSGINKSAKVGKFIKGVGEDAKLVFNLNENIKSISIFKQNLKVYLDISDLTSVSDKKLRMYLSNSAINYKTSSVYVDAVITMGQLWVDYTFDFTGKSIPTDITSAGGFNQAILVFSPDDLVTNGTVYYFDNLRATIKQPPYVESEPYYDWFNYANTPIKEEMNYVSAAGGTYTKLYNVSSDTNVNSSGSNSGIASKFIKIAGNYQFAQIRYNFNDGAIKDTKKSITFRLKALFKPKTTTEINMFDDTSRSVTLFLQNQIGDAATAVQIKSSTAYFTQTNKWETLEFTFSSSELRFYDRLMIMVAKGYTNPINDNGVVLDEDLVYYFESLSANEDINVTITDVWNLRYIDSENQSSDELTLFPNPVNSMLRINKNVAKAEIYNNIGQVVNLFHDTNSFDVSGYLSGIYFLNVKFKNGENQTLRFTKK